MSVNGLYLACHPSSLSHRDKGQAFLCQFHTLQTAKQKGRQCPHSQAKTCRHKTLYLSRMGDFFSLLFKSWGKEESYLKTYLGTCLQRWDAGIVTEKRDQRKTVWREMDSAVLSINYNLIPNGDTFGILDNMSEFVQKSIKSSWHYRTYKNVSLMEWKKKRRSSSKQEGARTSTHLLNLSSLHVVPSS